MYSWSSTSHFMDASIRENFHCLSTLNKKCVNQLSYLRGKGPCLRLTYLCVFIWHVGPTVNTRYFGIPRTLIKALIIGFLCEPCTHTGTQEFHTCRSTFFRTFTAKDRSHESHIYTAIQMCVYHCTVIFCIHDLQNVPEFL